MSITLHTTWPLHMDYPLWRAQIRKYKPFIDKGMISLSDNHEGNDFSQDIKNFMGEFGFPCVDPVIYKGDEDWRNKATNAAWQYMNTDWLWFTEQDFFIRDKSFFERVFQGMKEYDAIVYQEQNRLHPACFFVKKSLADRTSRDFAAKPGVYDHFAAFADEVMKMGKLAVLEELGIYAGQDYFHLTGLTHNYYRVMKMGLEPTLAKDFSVYNHFSLQVSPQIEPFFNILLEAEKKIKPFEEDHFLVSLFKDILYG